ncbi:MAG: indolepyruvate ferredoxin oxidoreductase subunit alpha [Candidatus Thermoplasmatota archaeon]
MTLQDLIDPESKKAFMLGNEAIARSALESDVKVTSFFPGSPTNEILDTMYQLSGHFDDLKMEVAANEKVALETAAGASMAGVRGFTSMKSVGLNVASDTFFSLGYTGVNAGMVLLIADDPHAHSSQSEQDGRYYAEAAHVPMFEPSTAQEAYEAVKHAFKVSEKYEVLSLIRTTTRVNHQSANVEIGELERTPLERKEWSDVEKKFYTLGAKARELKKDALEKLENIREDFEDHPMNKEIEGSGSTGIITSGVSYLHTLEALEEMDLNLPILKLGTTHPLPDKTIKEFIEGLDKVVMVEELLPYLEDNVREIAKEVNPELEIRGKESGDFSKVGEYNVPRVVSGISSAIGEESDKEYEKFLDRGEELKEILSDRSPIFCPGCPHRSTLWAVQEAIEDKDYVFNNDIGCYSMFLLQPYEITDSVLCMGSSMGLSSGMQHVLEDDVIAMIGDSTLFHAGLPGLVNAVHNQHNFTLIILDNSVTAMTGQQPNPGSDFGPDPVSEIDIEKVVKGIGVEEVRKIDAFSPKESVDDIEEAIEYDGVSVVISEGPCALYHDRLKRKRGEPIVPNRIDEETCRSIYACIEDFYCPAIEIDEESGKSEIHYDLCDGCMVCGKLCPVDAMESTRGDEDE